MERFYMLQLIENQMNHYSPAEQSVANFVLEHPEEVLSMTTKQLAAACQSSEATIIRFCKRIGINSFKGLKIEIAKEVSLEGNQHDETASPLQFEDDLVTVVSKVTAKTIQALNNTKNLVSIEQLDQAVCAMHEAERIYVFGAGGSSLVANDLTQKLLRIDFSVFQSNDIHVQMMMAANMTERDILFVVSTSGKTREILQLLSIAKEKGTSTILLTQHGKSPAKRMADILLSISNEEQNIRIGTMTARIAQLAVIDILFIALCTRRGSRVYKKIIDTHQAVQRMQKQ
ncbi:MurR/RpiR family transcriptional regulator [Falsibacillus albus]|uniref:MurR/RpiR family transcriptional regulator n=1 Tax=Falsibacillus albus TaxID=2478915 RepID=A0A3L7K1C2_9BACI|nr:MurR/RpiR family transcriptional regulator [Falsibacillus albus]RLQ96590.1 MurR/RpiR family transcriptional regulator [Falsibacillus albus]